MSESVSKVTKHFTAVACLKQVDIGVGLNLIVLQFIRILDSKCQVAYCKQSLIIILSTPLHLCVNNIITSVCSYMLSAC